MKKIFIVILILVANFAYSYTKENFNKNFLTQSEVKYYFQNGEYYLEYNQFTFIGTSIHPIYNGYLTLLTLEETAPTWLRIYDNSANIISCQKIGKVINISISENMNFLAYYDGNQIIIQNLSDNTITKQDGSVIFSVDNEGYIATTNSAKSIRYRGKIYHHNQIIRKIIFFDDKILFSSSNGLYILEDQSILIKAGNCLNLKHVDSKLSFTIKNKENIQLYETLDLKKIDLLQEKEILPNPPKTHEEINSPLNYYQENYLHPIGNSYAEIQEYSGVSYLHPGVDFLGDDFQDVFAVHDGYVKAILTTGGDPYWRIAIANENSSEETEGYLYAHLNEDSFTVGVGDFVEAGDILGTLYPWNYYDFTHIHYARIYASGVTWNGDWWTADNPQVDTINLADDTSPVFENCANEQLFAFRDFANNYLEPSNLSGEFDIIAKCYDLTNSQWKIDIWEIEFELSRLDNPDEIVFFQFAFAYDFPLDTYGEGSWDAMVLNTIYSRDETYYSEGNYEMREYYHLITNSDGDENIDETDAENSFNSTNFSDGDYILKVTARDASLNENSAEMIVTFNNGVSINEEEIQSNNTVFSYPNPFKLLSYQSGVNICFNNKMAAKNVVEIYNLKGQKVKNIISSETENFVTWNGKNEDGKLVSEGIYFYKVISNNSIKHGKIILMK